MKDFSITILNKLLTEMRTYPLGDELEKAVMDLNVGIPFFEMILSDGELSVKIFALKKEIHDFINTYGNTNYPEDKLADLKKRRDETIEAIKKKGYFINYDILDNIWERLPEENGND